MSNFPTIPPGMGWPFVDEDTGEFQSNAVKEWLAGYAADALGDAQGVIYPEGSAFGVALTYDALDDALVAAAASGKRVWAAGEFDTDQTLTVKCDCDLAGVTINYTGSGVAVRAGTATGYVMHKDMRLPRVVAANKAPGGGWAAVAGTIGVDISNLYSADVYVPLVQDFETGMRVYGTDSNGVSYVTITVGHLHNNKVNEKMDASSTGWANQVTHIGGRWSHNSDEGTNVAGTKHILIENITGNADPNNNVWLNPSLESPTVVEWTIDAQGGSSNMWFNPRMEFTSGASKVRWGSGAVRNTIFGGNQIDSIVETFVSGQSSNSVIGTGRFRFSGQGATGGVVVENEGSSTQPALSVMRSGGTAAGDSVGTAYVAQIVSNSIRAKQYNDAFDRVQVNGATGAILLGAGTAAPVAGISGVGAFLFFTAGATTVGPVTDGGASIGQTGNYRLLNVHQTGYHEMQEMTAPAAPGANKARLFTRDNGAGKTQLCVIFPTGAVQVISTEP